MAEAPCVSFVVQSSSTYSPALLKAVLPKQNPPNLPNHFAKQKNTQRIQKPGVPYVVCTFLLSSLLVTMNLSGSTWIITYLF